MEARAKVTSKGQVTIPIDVRRALGIGEGDTLAFELSAHYVTVRKRRSLAEVAAELGEAAGEAAARADASAAVAVHASAAYTEKERRRGRLAIVGPDGAARRAL